MRSSYPFRQDSEQRKIRNFSSNESSAARSHSFAPSCRHRDRIEIRWNILSSYEKTWQDHTSTNQRTGFRYFASRSPEILMIAVIDRIAQSRWWISRYEIERTACYGDVTAMLQCWNVIWINRYLAASLDCLLSSHNSSLSWNRHSRLPAWIPETNGARIQDSRDRYARHRSRKDNSQSRNQFAHSSPPLFTVRSRRSASDRSRDYPGHRARARAE